ncbi:MAG: 4Fe-4S dicluster domain-containing protein [Coriobacteriia bacterium]|jgi:protein NrfC|nr:4Fe-4S dicluster domain-containing protein [Coriobacteriia bacterium]
MADIDRKNPEQSQDSGFSRRQFVTGVGGAGLGLALGGFLVKGFLLPREVFAIPASQGYLLVDTKKCAGCASCMMACSLTHHGKTSQALSRIQITQDPFGRFPNDIQLSQCRQCPFPSCVDACPTGAMHADEKTGVRTVDESKCIGCERCVNACPFTPSRALWNFEEKHAQKCDLCEGATFWDQAGGPDGKRACEEVCPMGAIQFTDVLPEQTSTGYEKDMRTGTAWDTLGFGGAPVSLGHLG